MKNVINRAFMAKKRILFVLAAVGLFAASSWAQVDPCAPVTDTVTVTFKLDDGSLTGNFTVNASGKKVAFSKGNLQYTRASTSVPWSSGQFSFMEHQYDVVETSNVSADYASETAIGLFGWATSGWDNRANDVTAVNFQPYATSKSSSNTEPAKSKNPYQYGPSIDYVSANSPSSPSSYDSWFKVVDGKQPYKNYDWGVYNAISNGGNQPGIWRTLTGTEWDYIAYKRPDNILSYVNTMKARFTIATINTDGTPINGVIIFPDNYNGPRNNTDDITWGNINSPTAYYRSLNPESPDICTECTTSGWEALENAGCVFLPAAGKRNETTLQDFGRFCMYHSASPYSRSGHIYVYVGNNTTYWTGSYSSRYMGMSVRLVKDVTE